jgi:multidrug efflux pump subunit AcrB
VRALENQRNTVADLENIHVTFMNMEGRRYSFPLTSVASIRRTSSVTDIRRKDMKRVITVTGDAEGRLASEVLEDVKARLANFELPAGYTIKFTGKDEEQKKAETFLKNAFVITLLLVFLILVSEFNSIRVPFVIMLSVLLSLIGVMIGLMVTRLPFSVIMTGVGVVALAGIVVRNGIILLDFAKQKLQQGVPLEQALVEADRVRLRRCS